MTTSENPHAGQGMVVLDIGDDIGALVVSAPSAMAGSEIEICPAGMRTQPPDDGAGWWHGEWHTHAKPAWPHVAVVGRPSGDAIAYAAVYPGLREGDYELWQCPDGATALAVRVQGARVTEAAWPATHP